jgi:hypothetical protein
MYIRLLILKLHKKKRFCFVYPDLKKNNRNFLIITYLNYKLDLIFYPKPPLK